MIRDTYFKKQVLANIQSMEKMDLISPLGYYDSPEIYINYLEDYIKLSFEINKVPDEMNDLFIEVSKSFQNFKYKLKFICKQLEKHIRLIEIKE